MDIVINAIRGFCMALADSVPGVSGGTIAFVLGIYDKFINSLERLAFGNRLEKKESIIFLAKLGLGWVIGMILAILVLTMLFENNIYKVSSLFIGFIIFAIPYIIFEEKESIIGKYKNVIFTVIGILIVVLITFSNPVSGTDNVVDIKNLNFALSIYVFVAAMVAISAMVLPGISGSTLLLIFGLYMPILSAIKEVLHLNFSYIPVICIFCLGIVAGILVIIKLVKNALKKYRSQTMYLIIGLMLGSLYAIVMGPTTLEVPKEALSIKTFSIIFFVIGGIVIFGLQKLREFLESKEIKKLNDTNVK